MSESYLDQGRSNQKRQTRNNLLKAAKQLLGRDEEFTLDKVAQIAGVSRATIYRYYSDKDVLSAEAVLDMRTTPPESVVDSLSDHSLSKTLRGIQHYYNSLTADNEKAFRKYLSVILDADKEVNKRGGRRIRALEKALAEKGRQLPEAERTNLVRIATLLMGIEAYIVMKDVCGLDTEEADATLEWGLQTLLRGIAG